jgi:diguanylate cyclase (GGDEF)-like protein
MKNIENIAKLKNVTVLYVEDEQGIRDVTAGFLKNFTKEQFVAVDGAEGLEYFRQYSDKIDLVITDINMPNMNGLEMSLGIKEINPQVPIIVATAFSNTEYLLEAINMGIDKYILKPIDIHKLLEVMSNSLVYHELKNLYLDTLTQLPNRNRMKKDLSVSGDKLMALINIDRFSTLNDLYGESNGDKILLKMTEYIKSFFIDNCKCYRIEADKFAVIIDNNCYTSQTLQDKFIKFNHFLDNNHIDIGDDIVDVNVTIGIAYSPANLVYNHTQRAIYYARKKLLPILIYDKSYNLKKTFKDNILWVKRLKDGLYNNKFRASYQPIIDNKTQKIYKYEALIRYISDDGELIAPCRFLDIAKKARLFPHIIRVMIEDVFRFIRDKGQRVAINISFDDIVTENTIKYIKEILEINKDYTYLLDFELLESEEIKDFKVVKDFISMVKTYNCNVGVDDFGAGYSNFNMLVELDVDFVKIDASLIKDIVNNKKFKIISKTIAEFCKQLELKTVAEFVSSKEIYEEVCLLGIDYSQGYYFGEPEFPKNI